MRVIHCDFCKKPLDENHPPVELKISGEWRKPERVSGILLPSEFIRKELHFCTLEDMMLWLETEGADLGRDSPERGEKSHNP